MADFTLYAESLWISPYVFSSHVALREKKAAFKVVEMALIDGAHRQPDYYARSVTGRVPSLEHGDYRLAESSAIAEYLEEVLPPPSSAPLFPRAVRDRARARQIMAWLRSDLPALRDDRSTITMFYRFKLQPLSGQAQRDADRLLRVADELVPADGAPLFGEWSLVDSELAFMLQRLLLNSDPVPERVATYARAQWTRPSVREFVQHARPSTVPPSYWVHSGTPEPKLA
jgi:glutathione S-transferase